MALVETFCICVTCVSVTVYYIFDCVESDHRKGVTHGEEHPDVYHLDVGGCREGLGDSDEARSIKVKFNRTYKYTYNVAKTKRTVRLT